MPLPVVLVGAVIAVAVVGGGAAAVDGGVNMRSARGTWRRAEERHAAALAEFRKVENQVQERAREYGERQILVQAETLGAWVRWLEQNERKVKHLEREFVDGIEVQLPNIPELKARVVKAGSLLSGGAKAAAGGIGAYQAALWGVGSFASASTGTAIGGLSGAAATNATLAWLGGGSIAAGGGGVALGGIMLTGIAVAPAALIAGFTIGVQGHKAKTKAMEAEAQVSVAVAEMAAKRRLLGEVERRIDEIQNVLDEVDERARLSLAQLESVEFNPDLHVERFQETALLMRALGEILETPIVDDEGGPSERSLKIKRKYSA